MTTPREPLTRRLAVAVRPLPVIAFRPTPLCPPVIAVRPTPHPVIAGPASSFVVVVVEGAATAEATLCASERASDHGLVWLGIRAAAGSPCVGLAVSLELFEDDDDGGGDDALGGGGGGAASCHRMSVPDAMAFAAGAAPEPLPINTARVGSCGPYEWADYAVTLSPADRANNLLFEVEDTSGRNDPVALSLHVFAGAIPDDRATEDRSERAHAGAFFVYKVITHDAARNDQIMRVFSMRSICRSA